jgi:hypothetical protein
MEVSGHFTLIPLYPGKTAPDIHFVGGLNVVEKRKIS